MLSKEIFFKKSIFIIGILFLISLIFLGYIYWLACLNDTNLRVIFLDIGQGDATLIQTPAHQNILIDGGPDINIINKLDKYISFDNRIIDIIILTHTGLDHLTGLVEVLERYPVKQIISNGLDDSKPLVYKWQNLIKKKNIPHRIIDAPIDIKVEENVLMKFFWPQQSLVKDFKADDNFTSIVMKLVYKNNSFLFTGDATKETEAELINNDIDLSSDVFKAGHHGSKYSSTMDFLKKINPSYGVISSGENQFGHPSLRVLKNLTQLIPYDKIFRTDKNGDIIFKTNGNNLVFQLQDSWFQ
ncbi:MBL fold metallo-hydrolase [Patescibacteria group bacterium]|nr:MBL fold metallo-hydrolase [Patescibacteria group bacterium]